MTWSYELEEHECSGEEWLSEQGGTYFGFL